MTQTLELPLWLIVVAGLLALASLLSHILIPSVRWYLRRRINRVINEVNTRLQLRLPSFKLTKREVLIDRVTYDADLLREVERLAEEKGVSRDVLMERVKRYAREIVPAFNAMLYFQLGYRLARQVVRLLYRVRLGSVDNEALKKIGPNDSVVFVMNHRSNMDYVLAAYLAADKTALSYAVGEWARVWPLQQLIRSMGAYFVRRSSGDDLYRRVLAAYVRMATEAGVPQAIYPEGGLTRDGYLRPPKLGIISYMTKGFDPVGERDIVFIPIGINYDRVLEDRTLLLDRNDPSSKRSGSFAVRVFCRMLGRHLLLMLRKNWHRFGYACVNFGSPVSLKSWLQAEGIDSVESVQNPELISKLGQNLMEEIGRVIPVLPVSLVATVFYCLADEQLSELEVKVRVQALIDELEAGGAQIYVPRSDQDYALSVGLRMLLMRHLIVEENGLYRMAPHEKPLLEYYAASVAHLLGKVKEDARGAEPSQK